MFTAVWLAVLAMTSFFLALTYAYLQRHILQHEAQRWVGALGPRLGASISGARGAAAQGPAPEDAWMSPQLAAILTVNTAILIASSVALERARAWLAVRGIAGTLRWLTTAFALGLAFLAGQTLAWRTLFSAGVYLQGHPNSAFFYLVTAAHAAHLALALALLAWLLSRAWRGRLVPDRPILFDLTRILYHALALTWCYLWATLLFLR